MRLDGKVAYITGAGSGIGKASALLFANEGAKVGLVDLRIEELKKVKENIESIGGQAVAVSCDVSAVEDTQRAVKQVAEAFGGIDIVFANAGVNGVWAALDQLEPEDWDNVMAINLRGTYLTVKYCLPYLKRNGGAVTVTSSVNGTRMFSNTGATAYSVTKAGQVAFAKMIALELAKHKIRVNVICPGAIKTNISGSTETRGLEEAREPVEFPEGEVPLTDGRPGQAEQVAQLVAFLSSDEAAHISGAEIFIDGAQSLLQG